MMAKLRPSDGALGLRMKVESGLWDLGVAADGHLQLAAFGVNHMHYVNERLGHRRAEARARAGLRGLKALAEPRTARRPADAFDPRRRSAGRHGHRAIRRPGEHDGERRRRAISTAGR